MITDEGIVHSSARKYVRWGWRVVPIPAKTKGPHLKNWQLLRLKQSELPHYFSEGNNIGVLLGQPSGGLVDVDLDCREAAIAARTVLPYTGRIHGRKAKPASHYWYRANPIPDLEKFCDIDGTCLLELRSTGQQTIVPPSVHPCGERMRWCSKRRAARLDGKVLRDAVARTAAAALLGRHWPAQGTRDEVALALSGMLLRAGWKDAEVEAFVGAVTQAAHDEEWKARQKTADSTLKRLDKGTTATGRPRLAELLGEDVVARACEWLGIKRHTGSAGRCPTTACEWPEPLADAAYHGLAGDLVRAIEPQSEADPAALLIQTLVAFGNAIGISPYYEVEGAAHHANLFGILVGRTAKARKGTSWSHVQRIFERADRVWVQKCVVSGLSTGEGLIWAVRDPIEKQRRVRKGGKGGKPVTVIEDQGVSDKRLMVYEPELSRPLRAQRREGNTLSPTLRQAYDSGRLRILTKNSPVKATDAHISLVGHITQDELRRELTATDEANGFANRFLFLCVRRSKLLPRGGRIASETLDLLASKIRRARKHARQIHEMTFSKKAEAMWDGEYKELTADVPGLLGAIIARAEAQVVRLSTVYALLDCSAVIKTQHLRAALEAWRYCRDSARYIFGDALGDPVADAIRKALKNARKGLSRTEIRNVFARNRSEEEISRALGLLVEQGLARSVHEDTAGRPVERWFAIR
jgi:hypothetical protein